MKNKGGALGFFLGMGVCGVAFAAQPMTQGKAFNPDISANFLGLWQHGTGISNDRTNANHNGFSLQEAELQLLSDVDPYMRASALLSVSQKDGTSDFGIDPEEVFLETTSLPGVTVKAGKFKMALGRHNQLHTHAFPFIDAPLIHQQLIGSEGLNEAGVSAAVLMPTSWYSELTVQGFNPSNDTLYKSPSSGDVGGLVHFKNLLDVNDDLTSELGLSATAAKNQFNQTASVLGADLTFKWRPAVGGKYHALIWSTEYLDGHRPKQADANGASQVNLGGVATWLQYQLDERWWVQGRYEYVGIPRSVGVSKQMKESALIAFLPSEFSGIRLQYDHSSPTSRPGKDDHTIAVQYNVTIGAHPAHSY